MGHPDLGSLIGGSAPGMIRKGTQDRIVGERKDQTNPSDDASSLLKKFFGPNVTVDEAVSCSKVVSCSDDLASGRAAKLNLMDRHTI